MQNVSHRHVLIYSKGAAASAFVVTHANVFLKSRPVSLVVPVCQSLQTPYPDSTHFVLHVHMIAKPWFPGCRQLAVTFSGEESAAVGNGVRKQAVTRAYQEMLSGSGVQYLKPASEAFPGHVSGNPADVRYWPLTALTAVHQQKLALLGQLLVLTVLWDISAVFKLPHAVTYSMLFGPEAASERLLPQHLREYSDAEGDALVKAEQILHQSYDDPAQVQEEFEGKMAAFDGVLPEDKYQVADARRIFRAIMKYAHP